jgi:phosphomannomutase
VLPIILSLSLAWRQGIKLSKLADSLPRRFTHSDRLQKFAPGRAKALTDWIAADHRAQSEILAPNSGSVSSIDMTDGLRVTFENDDIVHLRASGNAPELRCYVESDTTDRAEALCAACLGRIAALSVILDVG